MSRPVCAEHPEWRPAMWHKKREGLLVGLFWLDFDRVLAPTRRWSPRLTDADSTVAVTAASRTAESAAPAAPTASSLTRASAAVRLVRGVAFVHRF
jgi:hypothetical protein